MHGVVFLTGPTGFLGTQIARRLLTETDHAIVALVRAGDFEEAVHILSRAWWDWPDLAHAIGGRVLVRCGDVIEPNLGVSEPEYQDLVRRTTHIIHTAADLRVNAPLVELRRTNVQGVANILELARAIHRDHGLSRLTHVSTAYVCGRRSGPIAEDELCHYAGFGSAYEQSKYEGELLVQAARRTLPISVTRPGMIVGDSCTGAVKTFNTVYFPLRLYLTGSLRVLPVHRSFRVNNIPVDYVASAIVRLTFDERATGLTFHLTAPPDTLPAAEELVSEVRQWARENLHLSLPRPIFVPPVLVPRRPSWLRLGSLGRTLDGMFELGPYFRGRQEFLRENTDRLLGPYYPDWRELLPRLLGFAVAQGFMHRLTRTVHEQIRFRLQSTSRPVTYYDVAEGRIHRRDARDVLTEMEACVGALHSLGVRPGDRVAIVGHNSSRYLAIDVAIGLVGAVSVPLYYTSSPSDINALLEASGAHALMIGAPRLLEHLNEVQARVPVVSFHREPPPPDLARSVLSWDQFLGRGGGSKQVMDAPVGPEDQATIRYTSGTTGQPKGAIFTHQQLGWMGSTTASLLPWQARTHPATYLSFLPMNHVVEGILATYASYYIPAPLHVYFLEDFHDLPAILPRVRPTIFFSVPRVYEKIWDGLTASRLGRAYARLPRGFRRRALRPLVRRVVLRRAGLDRCAQLVVGSAPIRTELLQAFHDLGIEIHNAYGETEAPLVSMNRPGANVIGTAGQLLPQTDVRVSEEGELLVRGPQVAVGYADSSSELPVVDGWLRTGDLGAVTDEGCLVVRGRKKEFIATSYGKKIFLAKVEALLRAIPGVEEAMVVGEGKPYCVALLWVQTADEALFSDIDLAVIRVNAGLSHPEQVERWAMLSNDLSVSGGELTAKGDLKRQIVGQRFAPVIESLYAGTNHPTDAIHHGQVELEVSRVPKPLERPHRHVKVELVGVVGRHAPLFLKRRVLEILFACTADAFGRALPPGGRRSYGERLEQYARFTQLQVEAALDRHGDLDAIRARLYQRALHLGLIARKVLHLTTLEEAMAVSRMLYRMIDIDFSGTAEGDVTIAHCYFSRFYTSQVCRVISSLDAGILAGLSGGAHLEFLDRITEGCDRCRARLTAAKRAS